MRLDASSLTSQTPSLKLYSTCANAVLSSASANVNADEIAEIRVVALLNESRVRRQCC